MPALVILSSEDISDAKAAINAAKEEYVDDLYSKDLEILSPEERSKTTFTMSPSLNSPETTDGSPIRIL